jgi:pimeloyl-ACP methyl ester carboxylesterase
VLALACVTAHAVAADPGSLPAAVYTDPAPDAEHPASGLAAQFRSHGALLNAQIYRPPGAGRHPTVLMFHGLPGNELNLDLAQVLRRAGWTVVTFHYTGAWGSGGRFSIRAGFADADALLAHLRDPGIADAWGADPDRVLVLGHSYGGYAAAHLAASRRDILGAVLLAPWDPSFDARSWQPMSPSERSHAVQADFDDVDGRLTHATAVSLGAEVMQDGLQYDLTKLAASLTDRPVLLITATRDDDDDEAVAFIAQMRQLGAPKFARQVLDSDHSFNTQRIALQAAVLRWIEAEHLGR